MISSCLGPAIILEYIHALSVERPEWKKKERVLETIPGSVYFGADGRKGGRGYGGKVGEHGEDVLRTASEFEGSQSRMVI